MSDNWIGFSPNALSGFPGAKGNLDQLVAPVVDLSHLGSCNQSHGQFDDPEVEVAVYGRCKTVSALLKSWTITCLDTTSAILSGLADAISRAN